MNIDAHPNHDRINEKTPRIVGTIVIRAPSHRTLRHPIFQNLYFKALGNIDRLYSVFRW